MRMPPVRTRRWTRSEYDRLVEIGVLGREDRVELLDGLLVVREPQGSRHVTAVLRARLALERAFGPGFHARPQAPVALDETSEPEPDVAMVRGHITDYRDAHPSSPVLVVEVADSTLVSDRLRKGPLYARAGVADYWILNLVDRVLEVYRGPARSPTGQWAYRRVRAFGPNASVAPLAAAKARIRVADLLP